MKREELDFVISHNNYLKGGTKEACVKIREVLSNKKNPGNQLHAPCSCVNIEEFVEAVKVLLASSFTKEDEIPTTWYCDNDCSKVGNLLCPGECNISKDANILCPYFSDSVNI